MKYLVYMRKRVLITGSSRGIGRAIALAAAKDDYEVILHYKKKINFELSIYEWKIYELMTWIVNPI